MNNVKIINICFFLTTACSHPLNNKNNDDDDDDEDNNNK